MTQRQTILKILKEKGVVDNYYCIDNRLTIRLGAIIEVLRKQGYQIETKMVEKNCHYYLLNSPTTQESAPRQERNHSMANCPSYKAFRVYCPICRIKEEKQSTLFQ
jgi:hypothetical protein